jgi:hypothetical protein
MKENNDKPFNFSYDVGILFVILFIISGTALYLSFVHIDYSFFNITLKEVGNLLGIFVSTIGIIITAYFVILAIDAYSKVRKIDDARNEALTSKNETISIKEEVTLIKEEITSVEINAEHNLNELKKNVKNTTETIDKNKKVISEQKNQVEQLLKNYAETLYEEIDEQIEISLIDKAKERENALRIRRARLSYRFPMLDEEIRIKLLNELASIGEKYDIIHIQKIIQDREETRKIRDIAKRVLEVLKKRLD